MADYALESTIEFERLERQSSHPNYDFRTELASLAISIKDRVLDAGCGSGVLCRYFAAQYPLSHFIGCDLSGERVALATQAAGTLPNIEFQQEDATRLSFPDNTFDVVICRYLLQHLRSENRDRLALGEFLRVLKPGGRIYVVDTDGLLFNLFPVPKELDLPLKKLSEEGPVDLFVGRKIPSMLIESSFCQVQWETRSLGSSNSSIEEIQLMQERFMSAHVFFSHFLGSESEAQNFYNRYLTAMRTPGTVYFLTKFIVSARKSAANVRMIK